MRRIILLVTAALMMAVFASVAQAQPTPNKNAPIGGTGSHTHYVLTGNGECVRIDSVSFERVARGLHQGAGMSGLNQGPEHGPCPTPS